MWNSSFDVSANGGFMSDTQQGSASKKKEQVRRVQSLVPLFISYINECSDEELTLYGMPIQMVDIVGVVRNYVVQSTKATCTIQDQSGSISAILWLESDGNSVSDGPQVKENCYARIFGSMRTQDGERMIMILKIIPINDLNIVTHHHLQVLHAKLYAENLANNGGEPSAQPMDGTSMGAGGSMSFSDIKVNGQENQHGLKPFQNKIMNLLKTSQEYMGLTRTQILEHFEAGQAREVRSTLDFLLDEGYAYTTCDNDHFKATDGF